MRHLLMVETLVLSVSLRYVVKHYDTGQIHVAALFTMSIPMSVLAFSFVMTPAAVHIPLTAQPTIIAISIYTTKIKTFLKCKHYDNCE
jgi:hypothetical protein